MSGPAILDARQWAFVASARRAVLATIGPTGRPRSVPICFVVVMDRPADEPRLYSPLDDKPKAAADPRALARVRDLVARPEATLLVDRWSEDWDRLAWVRLEVHGELVEPGRPGHEGAVAALRAKYPQYATHDLGHRPLLRFAIERIVAWGDLAPADGDGRPG